MSENLIVKIYTKFISVIVDSIAPSIIFSSIKMALQGDIHVQLIPTWYRSNQPSQL